jgi:AraC-like DNA-binding protein
MLYRSIAPGPAAARFVHHYWVLQTDDVGAVQRVVPDGSPELIVNLGAPFETCLNGVWQRQPRCFVAGQITGPLLLRPSGGASILGVNFLPHGLGELLGTAAHEFTGRMAPLSDVSRELASVGEATTVRELEARLVRLARPSGDAMAGEAVRQIASSNGTRDIASLARGFGVSTRQLERRFRGYVGLPPKLYARMRRFQSVFAALENDGANWAAAAIDCGYYDQAHLIRDFREFAGEPPAALLATDDLARHFLSHSYKTSPARFR